MADMSKSEVDRIVVPDDEKKRVIDLYGSRLPVPSVGIYEGAVRYYKASLEWAKIIEGHVDWLAEIAAWMDAEDENYFAIQQILIFLEGIDIAGEFPSEGGCPNFAPSAAFLAYEPQNPYNQPDYVPPDYLVPPFLVNTALEYPEIMGYQATDVFVNFAAINIDPINLATFNLPQMIITVKGSGQIELDLLATAFGGIVVIKVGELPNIADIILDNIIDTGIIILDLESASTSVIHAGNIGRIAEINIEAEPDEITEVFVVFAPKLNDSIIPIAFGGGIRAIQLCGFEGEDGETEVIGLEDIRFNSEICLPEKRVGGEWLPIEGWEEFLAECIGGGGMATKEDIRDGIYEAANRIALQIASGSYAGLNFSTDEDGIVTFPPADGLGAELPEDDPTTDFDESRAATFGGTIETTRALELLFDKVDTYYGNTNGTPTTPLATAQTLIKAFFDCDGALMDVAVASYYTYRGTNPRLLFDTTAAMQLYMFCRGSGERAWGQWLADQSGYAIAKFNVMNDLATALSDTFWSSYFASGAAKPSTQYLDATCVPIAPQTLPNMVFGTARTTTQLKASHRMRIQISGYALDVDGDIQDGQWYRTAGGVLTRSLWSWVHSAGGNHPSENQVVYNNNHVYDYTIDLQNLNQVMVITPNKHANMNAAGLTYPEPFQVIMTDLGEVTL